MATASHVGKQGEGEWVRAREPSVTTHTPEPMHLTLREKARVIYLEDERGTTIEIEALANPSTGIRVDYDEELRRAKHIAACVNACTGLTPLMPEGASVFRECVEALKKTSDQCQRWLKDFGGCDHSVGICACEDIREIDAAKQALAHAQGQERLP